MMAGAEWAHAMNDGDHQRHATSNSKTVGMKISKQSQSSIFAEMQLRSRPMGIIKCLTVPAMVHVEEARRPCRGMHGSLKPEV